MEQYSYGDSAAVGALLAGMGAFYIVYFVLIILMLAGMWKMFDKAGKPGWAAIVPIYNLIVWLEIVGRPIWWLALYLVLAPVVAIILSLDTAKVYGKDVGFALGLIFLPFVFYPILGFGNAQYVGAPVVAPAPTY